MTEKATEVFAAVCFLVIGLSHVAQPRAWVEFFIWLRGKGRAGVFANGLLSLPFGALVVAFHNVWDGLATILTVIGWAQVLKGSVCFVTPQLGMRSLAPVSPDRAWEIVVGGIFLLVFDGLLWYVVFTR